MHVDTFLLSFFQLLSSKVKPKITLDIQGQTVFFLCDTGASGTVVHPDDVPHVQNSDDSIYVKSASV